MAFKGPLFEDPLWYKDAIIYELRVRAFYDHDGDGIGDFRGLTEKLDYLQDLGVNALWLLPFYPSPLRDDGYDISDYNSVHPDVGTLADFKQFLREAHARGLRVITELVLNHTSDQHALFQRARRAPPGSKPRDFYVWSETPDRYKEARIIFKDFEHSNWAWDPVAKAYYWHRFYAHQPDLNFDNPEVRKFVMQTLDFWLEMGVDGLRLDAVPYLYEREGTNCENLAETHEELRRLRHHIDASYKSRMLLAEANQWPEDAVAYFGQGDECHMAFHFPIMPRMFMAIRMEDRFPIIEIISQTPNIAESCQWALFLRNHDELTLEMVTDEERDYMYRAYAQDPQARINLGIRHRLAPLMRNDRRRMELLNGLLFSLPGTPVLYYGDEIGMGDNIFLGDRNGVRTPMQWSADRNAGFSRANPQRLYLPVIVDPEYHYETVNVENQRGNPHSLLRWTRRLINLRKQYAAFGRGAIEFLYPENNKVLTFLRTYQEQNLLIVANLSRNAQYVELDLARFAGSTPIELFGRTRFPPIGTLPYLLTLAPHGFYWFVLEPPRAAHYGEVAHAPEEPLQTLSVRGRWDDLLRGRERADIERLLPRYLARTSWYKGEIQLLKSSRIVDVIPLGEPTPVAAILIVFLEYPEGASETVAIPLAFSTGEAAARWREGPRNALLVNVELEGRREKIDGVIHDAMADGRFAAALVRALGRSRGLRGVAGELAFERYDRFRELRGLTDGAPAAVLQREDRNSSTAIVGDKLQLKLYHLVEPEVQPDFELSRALHKAKFAHMLPLAATVEYRRGRGQGAAVATLRVMVPGARDAWQYTLEQVQGFYDRGLERGVQPESLPALRKALLELSEEEPPPLARELMGEYLDAARLLGRRTGELQLAMAALGDDPNFAPEPFSTLFRRSRYQSMRNKVRQVFEQLRKNRRDMEPGVRAEADRVLALEEEILATCRTFLDAKISAHRMRHHGRFVLRELLYTGDDFLVTSFEGDATLALSERRHKRSPMRDVVAMLRSFQYAAFAPLLGPRGAAQSYSEENRKRVEAFALFWQSWTSAAYLRSYFEVARGGGFLPTDRGQLNALLNTYLLEDIVSALGYEMANRPEWVRIPLYTILEIFAARVPPLPAPAAP